MVFASLVDRLRNRFNERIYRLKSRLTRTAQTMAKQTLMMIVFKRLKTEDRWAEAEPYRNELATRAKANGLKGIHAQQYTYTELARKFPPLDGSQPEKVPPVEIENDAKAKSKRKPGDDEGDAATFSPSETGGTFNGQQVAPLSSDGEFSVSGLGEIPANWGDLPSNASLAAEVSWVQANRLRVVRETSDRVIVDLSRALSPAPSYATLGWLETSIKTYSKYVDIAARATIGLDSEAADIRREVQSIEEVRKLLASML